MEATAEFFTGNRQGIIVLRRDWLLFFGWKSQQVLGIVLRDRAGVVRETKSIMKEKMNRVTR
jgi:hypothetical protein